MPIFSYYCEACQKIYKRLKVKSEEQDACDCGNPANMVLPSSVNSTTYELKDAHRGVQVKKNLDQQLKTRMNAHHDSTSEVLQKIDEHGMGDAIRNGWLKKVKKKI